MRQIYKISSKNKNANSGSKTLPNLEALGFAGGGTPDLNFEILIRNPSEGALTLIFFQTPSNFKRGRPRLLILVFLKSGLVKPPHKKEASKGSFFYT
jgi:hypothetical protein